MARFFSYQEIERGLITTRETVSEIAAAIMELEMFKNGRAVIFGSVAWGDHRWRSDIDIADFSKDKWESYTPADSVLFDFFKERYGSEDGFYVGEHLIEVLSDQGPKANGNYSLPRISPSTRDHFRLLAKVKGEPWAQFFKKLKRIPFRSRTEDIAYYLDAIVRHWYNLNKHLLGKHWLNWDDFKALQSLENFPKQLMRKILGEKNKLPSPDTLANIQAQFTLLEKPWAKELLPHFQPFFEIDPAYKALIDSMVNEPRLPEAEYGQKVCQLFLGLPIKDIVQIVEKAYALHDDHRKYNLWLASQ